MDKTYQSLGFITAGDLRRIINGYPNDTKLSFEFLVGSCFPTAYQNMLNLLREEHTKGYVEGVNENEGKIHS